MTKYVYEVKVPFVHWRDSEAEFYPYLCDSLDAAYDMAEQNYKGTEPITWETSASPGVYHTGTLKDENDFPREVVIFRKEVVRSKDVEPDFSSTRRWEVLTVAYRTFLGHITRSPYVGGTPWLFSVECGTKDCGYRNSSKAWDETRAQRALTDHHKTKHGLRED